MSENRNICRTGQADGYSSVFVVDEAIVKHFGYVMADARPEPLVDYGASEGLTDPFWTVTEDRRAIFRSSALPSGAEISFQFGVQP